MHRKPSSWAFENMVYFDDRQCCQSLGAPYEATRPDILENLERGPRTMTKRRLRSLSGTRFTTVSSRTLRQASELALGTNRAATACLSHVFFHAGRSFPTPGSCGCRFLTHFLNLWLIDRAGSLRARGGMCAGRRSILQAPSIEASLTPLLASTDVAGRRQGRRESQTSSGSWAAPHSRCSGSEALAEAYPVTPACLLGTAGGRGIVRGRSS